MPPATRIADAEADPTKRAPVGLGQRLETPGVDGGARAQEGVRLVERVRDEVEQRQVPHAEAALHEHEAHLRAGGPRERDLDATRVVITSAATMRRDESR